MTRPTAIHCPSCDRYLMEAEAVKAGKLRCRACRVYLAIEVSGGEATVTQLGPTATARP